MPKSKPHMNKVGKLIAWSVAIGFILLASVLLIGIHLASDSSKDLERMSVAQSQKEVLDKLCDYIEQNGETPQSLSEIGLEQTISAYTYNDLTFSLVNFSRDYVLQMWNEGIESQYISEIGKWVKEGLYEFEPPINIDTIRNINRIVEFRDKAIVKVDSVRANDNVFPIIDGFNKKPDSIAYLRYYYPDSLLMMEGWVAYRPIGGALNYDKEFGWWKYYSKTGDCYNKFWNFKRNRELIYEADR